MERPKVANVEGITLSCGVDAAIVRAPEGQYILGLELNEVTLSYWLTKDEVAAIARWYPDDYARFSRTPLFHQVSIGVLALSACKGVTLLPAMPEHPHALHLIGPLLPLGDAATLGSLAVGALRRN